MCLVRQSAYINILNRRPGTFVPRARRKCIGMNDAEHQVRATQTRSGLYIVQCTRNNQRCCFLPYHHVHSVQDSTAGNRASVHAFCFVRAPSHLMIHHHRRKRIDRNNQYLFPIFNTTYEENDTAGGLSAVITSFSVSAKTFGWASFFSHQSMHGYTVDDDKKKLHVTAHLNSTHVFRSGGPGAIGEHIATTLYRLLITLMT